MAARKAPGLDGWTVAELRLLPAWWHERVAHVLEAVERAGRWPETARQPAGLLLPKPGGGQRPIWLLPMVYRVWAHGRAPLWAAWREAWGPPLAEGRRGAESQAWALALELEAAAATGDALAGAALDWSCLLYTSDAADE